MPDLLSSYVIEAFSSKRNRTGFDCGTLELNEYFQNRAGQDVRRKVTTLWVALSRETQEIAGFYSLSMAAVPLSRLSEDIRKKLPRYGDIPAVRLGRLAVSLRMQGKGLGKYLVTDAMIRCLRNEIAWSLFLVDAKDTRARQFYENLGFLSFVKNQNHLYLPRTLIEREYFS